MISSEIEIKQQNNTECVNTNDRISLIITVYNGQRYLKKCLDSIVKQSYRNFRLILVDDGSTDSSPVIADQYAEKYDTMIKVIHQSNGGLSNARNTGLSFADGQYIAFADADDMLEPDYLEKLYNAAVINQADYVICGYTRIDESDHVLGIRDARKWEMKINDGRNHVFTYTAWGRLYRADLIKQSGLLFSDGEGLEDIPFNIYMNIASRKCIAIDYAGYLYRVSRESITEVIKQKGVAAAPRVMKFPFNGIRHTIELMRKNYGNEYDEILCYELMKNMTGLLFFVADSSDMASIKKVADYEQNILTEFFGSVKDNSYIRIRRFTKLPIAYRCAVWMFAKAYQHGWIYSYALCYRKLHFLTRLKKV